MNWKPIWSKVRVTVCRKQHNPAGWFVIIGNDRLFYRSKAEAVRHLKRTLQALRFDIVPAQPHEH